MYDSSQFFLPDNSVNPDYSGFDSSYTFEQANAAHLADLAPKPAYDFGTLTNYGTGWYSPELAAFKPQGIAGVRAFLETLGKEDFQAAISRAIAGSTSASAWAASGTGYPGIYAKNPDYAWNQFQTNAGKDQVAGAVWQWSPQGTWWQKTAGLGPAPDASEGFLDSVFVPVVKAAIGAALVYTGSVFAGEMFAGAGAASEAGGMSVDAALTASEAAPGFSAEVLNLPYGGATIDPAFPGQVFYTGGTLPVSISGAAGMSIAPSVFEASAFSLVDAAKQAKQIVSEVRNAQTVGNIISPPQTAPIKRTITMNTSSSVAPSPVFGGGAQENAQQAAKPANSGGINPAVAIAGQPENFGWVAVLGAVILLASIWGGK